MTSLVGSLLANPKPYSSFTFTLSPDDIILYNLATGCLDNSLVGKPEANLKYTYEQAIEMAFPTMSSALGIRDIDEFFAIPEIKELGKRSGVIGIPEVLLHGEEESESFMPMGPGRTYNVESRVKDVSDKGKMSIVAIEKLISCHEGHVYSKIISRFVLRGVTAEGHKGGLIEPMELPKAPDRQPDERVEGIKLLPCQNALYRLTGDKNLIHIDPKVAATAGFPQPILHGLCTHGITARAVFEKLNQTFNGGLHQSQISKIGARFTSHVFPGETLSVDLWR
jgi:acyl dehydratase